VSEPAKVGDAATAPNTTQEENRVTAGQRRINLTWETTQAVVAISITFTTLYVSARLILGGTTDNAAFQLLSNVFFLIVGTYFQRTNHQRVGGVKTGDNGR